MSDDFATHDTSAFGVTAEIASLAMRAAEIADRMDELERERQHTWFHLLGAIRAQVDAKALGLEQLHAMTEAMGDIYGTSYTRLWDRHMPAGLEARRIRGDVASARYWAEQRERNKPNGPTPGTWVGNVGDWTGPMPMNRIAVVYMLFDADDQPVYVGSTDLFRIRLATHLRDPDKPGIATWSAQQCTDREEAYRIEDQVLKLQMPKYNRKPGR